MEDEVKIKGLHKSDGMTADQIIISLNIFRDKAKDAVVYVHHPDGTIQPVKSVTVNTNSIGETIFLIGAQEAE